MTNFFSVISLAGVFLAATNLFFSATSQKVMNIIELAANASM